MAPGSGSGESAFEGDSADNEEKRLFNLNPPPPRPRQTQTQRAEFRPLSIPPEGGHRPITRAQSQSRGRPQRIASASQAVTSQTISQSDKVKEMFSQNKAVKSIEDDQPYVSPPRTLDDRRSRRRSRSVPGAFDIESDRTETPTPVPQQSSREQAWAGLQEIIRRHKERGGKQVPIGEANNTGRVSNLVVLDEQTEWDLGFLFNFESEELKAARHNPDMLKFSNVRDLIKKVKDKPALWGQAIAILLNDLRLMTNHIEKAQAEIVRQRDEIHHQKEMLEEQDAVVTRFTDENEGLLLDVNALKVKVNLRDHNVSILQTELKSAGRKNQNALQEINDLTAKVYQLTTAPKPARRS